jgi:hypothetical protein
MLWIQRLAVATPRNNTLSEMSGFLALGELNCARAACPEFIPVDFWSGLLVALDFYPTYLSISFYAISLYQHEFYLFLLSLCLTADTGVNVALQYIIRQPGPFPGCGTQFEMPSFSTQHSSMLVCMLMSFMLIWRISVPSKKIFLLFLFLYGALVARIFCGINSRWQLLAGSLVGTVEGLLYQSIIYFLIYPRYKNILSWRLATFLDIKDHLLSPEQEEDPSLEEHDALERQPSQRQGEDVPLVVVQHTQPPSSTSRQRPKRNVRFSVPETSAMASARAPMMTIPISTSFVLPLGTRL